MNNPINILYVDDEPMNLKLFRLRFQNKFNIITANDATEALQQLHTSSNINFVISDLQMPKMSGLELISEAKSKYPDIGYYILTAAYQSNDVNAALESGLIASYFRKPFNTFEIERALKNFKH